VLEARRPITGHSFPPLDEQAGRPGILELDEAVGISSRVADDEVAGEIAEEGVFESDPIADLESWIARCDERRELTPLAKERQDLPLLRGNLES
jgi:hypothetical protein